MSRDFNIKGGSASDSVADLGIGLGIDFFQPGISRFMPGSRDRDILLRILPAFDETLAESDAAFKTSFQPYRLSDGTIDKKTQSPAFAPFYLVALGYPYLGNSNTGVLSARTLKQVGAVDSPDDAQCPIYDCYQRARASDNEAWKALTEKVEGSTTSAVLPRESALVFFNACWSIGGQQVDQGIFICKEAGLEHLKGQLTWQRPASMVQPHDPQWPDYLLGDVTHPQLGLLAKVWLTQVGVGTISTYCMHYTSKPGTPEGITQSPLSAEHMAARHVLGSSQTLKIWDYQYTVNWMVQDGAWPRELIASACGQKAHVPPAPVTFDARSTSLPSGVPAPAQQVGLPSLSPALPQTPTQVPDTATYHLQVNGQIFEAPAGEARAWLKNNPGAAAQVRPANLSHDFMAPENAPGFLTPVQAPAPQMPTGLPVNPPAQNMSGASAGFPAPAAQMPGGFPVSSNSVAASGAPASQQGGFAPPQGGFASPQQGGFALQQGGLAPHLGGFASPQQGGFAAPQQGNPSAFTGGHPAAPMVPALGHAAAAQPEGIPGLRPENGGPAPMPTSQDVAVTTDPQPAPQGVPQAGASMTPLTPEELALYQQLRATPHEQLTTQQVFQLSTLSARASVHGQG